MTQFARWSQVARASIRSLAINANFTLTVCASQEFLTVTLRFPVMAERRMVEVCMAEIARAFCAVEPLTDVEVRGLYWQQERISEDQDSVKLRKAFTDPDYPARFDAALKATRLSFLSPALH